MPPIAERAQMHSTGLLGPLWDCAETGLAPAGGGVLDTLGYARGDVPKTIRRANMMFLAPTEAVEFLDLQSIDDLGRRKCIEVFDANV